MAKRSGLIPLDHQRVSLAISKLYGEVRKWALACVTSVSLAFPTWYLLKLDLLRVSRRPTKLFECARAPYLPVRVRMC